MSNELQIFPTTASAGETSEGAAGLPPRHSMPRGGLAKQAFLASARRPVHPVLDATVTSSPDCTADECTSLEEGVSELLSPRHDKSMRRASFKAAHHNLPSYLYMDEGTNAEIEQADLPKQGVRNRKLPDVTSLSPAPRSRSTSPRSNASPMSSPLVVESSAAVRPPWESTNS